MRVKHDLNSGKSREPLLISDIQFAIIVTLVFILVTVIGLFYHEMWRDEFQAWQVAKFSPDLLTFYKNQRIESGHLILWNIILYVISHFLGGIQWEPIVHSLIACSSVFVLNRYAPFSRVQKVLISFGYFFLYEYNIIAREYSLTVLLVLLIAYHLKKAPEKLVLLGILLGLLLQINYYSIVFACGLCAIIIYNLLEAGKSGSLPVKVKKEFSVGAAIMFTSAVLAIVQIFHGYNDRVTKQLSGRHGFEGQHIYDTMTRALSAFIPVPFFDSVNVWNHFIIEYLPVELRLILFVMVAVFLYYLFRKQKDILFFFIGCSVIFIAFSYQSIYGYARHQGHIYILFIAALWIKSARADKVRPTETHAESAVSKKIAMYGLSFIFSLHVLTSGVFYYKDIKYPFSNIGAMVRYIQTNHIAGLYLCGYFDYSTSPLSAYTQRPVYFPQSRSEAYFIDWSKSKPNMELNEIFTDISGKVIEHDSVVLILTNRIDNAGNTPIGNFDVRLPHANITVAYLGACAEPCMVKDEQYFFYKVKKK